MLERPQRQQAEMLVLADGPSDSDDGNYDFDFDFDFDFDDEDHVLDGQMIANELKPNHIPWYMIWF